MAFKITLDLADVMLAAAKDELDGGFMTIYDGPVPADGSEALDVGGDHTIIAILSESGDGVTGLTFDAPSGGVLSKNSGETWSGEILVSGSPTFFRICPSGDNGESAADTPRLQGTAGGPTSGRDLLLGADSVVANGTNTITVSIFNVLQTLVT